MFEEDRNSDRGTEIAVGFLTSFVALVFLGLIVILISEVTLSMASVIGGAILGSLCYWFSNLSYRLLFNKRKSGGGLLSNSALKFWCLIFGIGSIFGCVFALVMMDISLFFSSLVMIVACFSGWQLAKKRELKSNNTNY